MSRIGKSPISVPSGVEIKVEKGLVTVKGPKGELTQDIDPVITVEVDGDTVNVTRHTELKPHKAKHGLYRSLVANMIQGVSEGFKTQQELVGVGYRANVQGQRLDLMVGYSHNIIFEIPKEIKVSAEAERGKNPIITLESHDKQLIGHVAAKIRSLRKPEPYKGKGIKFVGEQLRRKAGKSAAK
ncbi:MAG: 50S ribosomal protein L6 [Vicingaceae bacterium]|jgi:large subunit ribosomal protein L6|nr:MAG: 50S ribosomal protein L6 [Flavobacteriales bacterium BRH_c54]MBL1231693.1 50S ribosomal protein L6 [Flavobacteriales bacterium]MBQ21309.1 50S ribosomal protein L6 [Flavobacteriales bacterium]MDF1674232.1 50S ribosomal protein L6 [Vicingaceae bacterium]|tara:strand:- start:104984 stop:105535 length:552 start_codon:yes stop_codon:yes gene_type:complete